MKTILFGLAVGAWLGQPVVAALITSNTQLSEYRTVAFAGEGPNYLPPPKTFSAGLGESVAWSGSVNTVWSPQDAAFGNNGSWRPIDRNGFIASSIRPPGERVWLRFDFTDAPAASVTVFMNYARGLYNGGDFGNPYIIISAIDSGGNVLESHMITSEAPIVITDNFTDAGAVRGISRSKNEIAALLIETNGRFFAVDDLRIARSTGGRLANLATRSIVGAGGNLVSGFVIAEAPTKMLLRAIGPSLATFNVSEFLMDPKLVLYKDNIPISINDDWSQAGDRGSAAADAAKVVGAFPLAPGSKDAALVVTLLPGSYTMVATDSMDIGGDVLIEAYYIR